MVQENGRSHLLRLHRGLHSLSLVAVLWIQFGTSSVDLATSKCILLSQHCPRIFIRSPSPTRKWSSLFALLKKSCVPLNCVQTEVWKNVFLGEEVHRRNSITISPFWIIKHCVQHSGRIVLPYKWLSRFFLEIIPINIARKFIWGNLVSDSLFSFDVSERSWADLSGSKASFLPTHPQYIYTGVSEDVSEGVEEWVGWVLLSVWFHSKPDS